MAYNSLEPASRQVCWSHLRRDFTFHADLGSGPQEAFGLDGLEATWNVFHAWKQFQQDGDRDALQQRVAAIKTQMRPLLEWGSTGKRQRHVRALAKNLLKLWLGCKQRVAARSSGSWRDRVDSAQEPAGLCGVPAESHRLE
jgi:Transposase IS66 family